jgi:hypothetical protein
LPRDMSHCVFFEPKLLAEFRKPLSEVVSDGSVDEVLFGFRQFAAFA